MKKNRKRAFTMAEMMVVIIILGVIAALVLPGMIQDHQKKINLAKTAKWYNAISNLVNLKEIDEEYIETVGGGITEITLPHDEALEYFASLDPIKYTGTHVYKNLNGTDCGEHFCQPGTDKGPALIMPDGTLIIFSGYISSEQYKAFAIDPNGEKGPNVLGHDLFVFAITKEDGVVPFGFNNAGDKSDGDTFGDTYDRSIIMTGKHKCDTQAKGNGLWCSALLIMDGWTFKDDYPY